VSAPNTPTEDFSEFDIVDGGPVDRDINGDIGDDLDEDGMPLPSSITFDDAGEVDYTLGYHFLDELDDDAAAALLAQGPESDQEERRRPVTGNDRVDAALNELDALDDLPTSAHADVYEEVHRRLQGALADLDVG